MKPSDTFHRLGDLFAFKNGRAFKKEEWGAEGLPIIRIQNLNNLDGNFNYYAGEYSDEILVQDGDLLFSWSGTVGSSFGPHIWQRGRGLLNQHIFRVAFKTEIDSRYAYYALEEITEEIEQQVSGAVGLVHITKEKLNEFTIPVPSLAEQRRIVGILDEAFEGIATAKANAERNLQNARALFQCHLQAVFTPPDGGWMENNLKSLTTKIGSGATPRGGEESYKSEGISLIRSLNVHDLSFKYAKLAFLDTTQADELSNVQLQKGDVLLNITGASVARCCIVPDDVLPARVNQHVSIIRPIADKLDADFLHYMLISKLYKDQLLQTGAEGGSTRQAITKAQIQEFRVKYPSTLKEQSVVVASLDAMLAQTQRLESLYQRRLAALDELKKTLLHRAFGGQLTSGESTVSAPNFIAFPVTIPSISTTDLHAGILAMAYQLHVRNGKPEQLTHVKAEKIAHMIEVHLGIDLGRSPIKDAAGPNDFPHLKKLVEPRAKKAGFFDFKRTITGAYRMTTLKGFDCLIERTRTALGPRSKEVEQFLNWILPLDVRQAEIIATVFAAWNNLLLDGKQPTDEEIVFESRENWHPDKLKIERSRFFAAIEWLRKQTVVPEGRGKRVNAKSS